MRVAKHQVFKLTQDVVAALRQMRQILLLFDLRLRRTDGRA